MRTLVWFRGKDLRIADHAPLVSALADSEVVPCFVVDPYFFDPKRAAELPHRMQFLIESLVALESNIAHLGSRLVIAKGKSIDVIPMLAKKLACDRLFAHRWTEPFARERDRIIAERLHVPFTLFEGETLAPPGSILTGAGTAFSVYTPFARAFRMQALVSTPIAAPKSIPALPRDVEKNAPKGRIPTLESLGLQKNPRLLFGGEKAGRARLKSFIADRSDAYDVSRDRMDIEGTSHLSVDLKFGTVSARTIWNAAHRRPQLTPGLEKFANELLWRELTHHTLFHRPELLKEPFRKDFIGFPYVEDSRGFCAWQTGKTGYPIVDAAARELLANGHVHNRARMITASFLTKHLLISYQRGEAHYMKWLTDGDWAQNNSGWQWSAGSGCDAQPYFRVFNPVTQGERYDPEGDYVRRWLPELAPLPTKYIHAPWTAPPDVLRKASITLGKQYPSPIVDHAFARNRFLAVATAHLKGRLERETS